MLRAERSVHEAMSSACSAAEMRACQVVQSEMPNACNRVAGHRFVWLHRAFRRASACGYCHVFRSVHAVPSTVCPVHCSCSIPVVLPISIHRPSDHDMLDESGAGLSFDLGLRPQRRTAATEPTSGAGESFTPCAPCLEKSSCRRHGLSVCLLVAWHARPRGCFMFS